MLPKVTVQIPTYNQKQYIKQALDSALAQTYENLQIIVSDDCSTEYDIFDYLSEYKDNSKVLIHRNEKNYGRVGNYRKTLFNLVKGEWFINLDGDDYFINVNFVKKGIESINCSKKTIVAFQASANLIKIEENKINYLKLNNGSYEVEGLHYINYLDNGVGFTHASIMFNTKYAKKSNFYNIDILDSDYFSFLKILKYGYIIFWDEEVYTWRQHANQESWGIDFKKVLAKDDALKDLKKQYADVNISIKKRMFLVTHYNLYLQIVDCFFNEKFILPNFFFILKKTKPKREYVRFLAAKIYYQIKKAL